MSVIFAGEGNWFRTSTQTSFQTKQHLNYSMTERNYANINIHRYDPNATNFKKNIWLFDVESDPEEIKDLSLIYPNVVHQLLSLLAFYNKSAVSCRYPNKDPASDPSHKRGDQLGAIGPWM